jgi:NAD dependent epimerase/dehydratase family enzyme
LGSGKQYMPWIHIEDLSNIFIKAIEDGNMVGPYNAVAPEHFTNTEFTKMLANIMSKPIWLPNVPSFVLKIIFGEMANIILKGSRVSAKKIISEGYNFQHPKLENALTQLLKND